MEPLKVLYLDLPAKKELNKSVEAKLEKLTSEVDTLLSQVIKLIGIDNEHTEITETTSTPNLDSERKDHDTKNDMQKLITHSRETDEILNLVIGLWLMLDSSAMHLVKVTHITFWLRLGSLGKKICQVPSEI